MNTIYDVSGKRELMIDDFLISKMRNVSFLQHTPVELPCDKNKPLGHYNSIVRNPDGTFFYYYRGDMGTYHGKPCNNQPDEFVGVAVSKDGLKWDIPQLNLFPGEPVPSNTIFFGKDAITHNLAPFYDTNPQCKPEERYKALAGTKETNGLYGFVSADGIHWKKCQDTPFFEYEVKESGGHMLDSLNVVFYSETEKCYTAYIRV